jgi:LCP family protein required for cell wall assembly
VSDDAGQPEVTVDTAPAQEALVASGFVPAGDDGGGLFGRFQDGASNISDMAGAAASLAGISDASSGPFNLLVMGVDARPGSPIDVGVKADAIMVVNIDPAAGECRMLSIPRDTRAELPGYGPSKVNHALLVGGVPYQMLVVENLLGLTLDHYVLVDFAAFQQVVDVVGGVTVTVPTELTTKDGATLFAAGTQTLDGARALTYARFRQDADGDIGRIRRQWSILRALGSASSSRDIARDVSNLLPAIEDHVRTDLSAEEMTALAQDLDGRCTPDTAESAILEGSRQRMADPILRQSVYFNVVDNSEVRAQVEQLLGEPAASPTDGRSAGLAGPPLLARRPGPTPLSAR